MKKKFLSLAILPIIATAMFIMGIALLHAPSHVAKAADGETVYVAEIVGKQQYASLNDAVLAAENGDTVVVLKDHDVEITNENMVQVANNKYDSFYAIVGKSITIDLNGCAINYRITATSYKSSVGLVGVFFTNDGGHLTVNDGKGTAQINVTVDDGAKVYGLFVNFTSGCSITINGGSYRLDRASDSLIYSGCSTAEGQGVYINDGFFYLGNKNTGNNTSPWLINVSGQNTAGATITGGTFNSDLNHELYYAFEARISERLAFQYNGDGELLENGNYNNDATYTLVPAVCYINEKPRHFSTDYRNLVGYTNFEEAFKYIGVQRIYYATTTGDAGWGNATTLTVINDCYAEEDGFKIFTENEVAVVFEKDFYVDNEFIIPSNVKATAMYGGDPILIDEKSVEGMLVNGDLYVSGNLTIENGAILNVQGDIIVDGELNNNGTINVQGDIIVDGVLNNDGVINIKTESSAVEIYGTIKNAGEIATTEDLLDKVFIYQSTKAVRNADESVSLKTGQYRLSGDGKLTNVSVKNYYTPDGGETYLETPSPFINFVLIKATGETYFYSQFEHAYFYAEADDEIVLKVNMSIEGSILIDKEITLNLNGQYIQVMVADPNDYALTTYAPLTVKGDGDIIITGSKGALATDTGALYINGGNYIADDGVQIFNGNDVEVSNGNFTESIPEDQWAPGVFVMNSGDEFVTISIDDYRSSKIEYLKSVKDVYLANGRYTTAGVTAIEKIYSDAFDQIYTYTEKGDIDNAVINCEESFFDVLTAKEWEQAVLQAKVDVRKYANNKNVSVTEERVAFEIEKIEQQATLADIYAQTIAVFDVIDSVAKEMADALNEAKAQAETTLLGTNNENITNVTTAMLASIYSATTLDEVDLALEVALEEQKEIIKYKEIIVKTGVDAVANKTTIEEIKDTLTNLSNTTSTDLSYLKTKLDGAIVTIDQVKQVADEINGKVLTSAELSTTAQTLTQTIENVTNEVTQYIRDNVIPVITENTQTLASISSSVTTLGGSLNVDVTPILTAISTAQNAIQQDMSDLRTNELSTIQTSINDIAQAVAPDGALCQAIVAGVKNLTDGLSAQIGGLDTALTSFSNIVGADITTIKGDVATIKQEVENIRTDDLTSIKNSINDVNAKLAPDGAVITAITTTVKGYTDNLSSELSVLSTGISTLSTTVNDNQTALLNKIENLSSELSSAISGLDTGKLADIKNTIDALNERLEPNGAFYTELIAGVKNLTDELSNQIGDLDTDLSTFSNNVGADITTIKGDVATIKQEVENIKTDDLTAIKNSINGVNEKLAPNGAVITAITTTVKGYTDDLSNELDALSSVISTLSTTVNNNQTALLNKIENLGNELSSAIGGLDSGKLTDIKVVIDALNVRLEPDGTFYNEIMDGVKALLNDVAIIAGEAKLAAEESARIAQEAANKADAANSSSLKAKEAVEQAQTYAQQAKTAAESAKTAAESLQSSMNNVVDASSQAKTAAENASAASLAAKEAAVKVAEKAQTAELKAYASQKTEELKDWLMEYIGATEDKQTGNGGGYSVTVMNVTMAEVDAFRTELENSLDDVYSESNKKLILTYYDKSMNLMDLATTQTEVDYVLKNFRSDVSLVESLENIIPQAQDLSNLEILLLAIAGLEFIIALIVIIGFAVIKRRIKKNGKGPDGDKTETIPQPVIIAVPESEPAVPEVEEPVEQEDEETSEETDETAEGLSFGNGASKSFAERLTEADEQLKENYAELKQLLLSYEDVKDRLSKPCESFRLGRKLLVKMLIRGKTLKVYLALDPKAYEESKFNHKDVGDKKSFAEVPLLMRVRSPRSVKRTAFLIEELANGLQLEKKKVEETPVSETAMEEVAVFEQEQSNVFEGFDKNTKTFSQRLMEADEQLKENHAEIQKAFLSYKKVKLRTSKPCESYRLGRKLLAKTVIRGKTLKVYFALDPKAYEESKFNHKDVGDKKSFAEVPLLMRVRSPRSVKRTVKLIEELASNNQLDKE